MHILIIGAAGMVGRKLAERLAKDGGRRRQAHRQADAARRDRARGACGRGRSPA